MADIGKYSCEINGVSTQAYLDVEGMYFCQILFKIRRKNKANVFVYRNIIICLLYSAIRKYNIHSNIKFI